MYASEEFGGGETTIAGEVSHVSIQMLHGHLDHLKRLSGYAEGTKIPGKCENHAATRRHDTKRCENKAHKG